MSIWQNLKRARKSSKDRWIGGVCGGLGAATPIPFWVWRAILLFSLLAFDVGLLLYVVLWVCMPSDRTDSELDAAPNGGSRTAARQFESRQGAANGESLGGIQKRMPTATIAVSLRQRVMPRHTLYAYVAGCER